MCITPREEPDGSTCTEILNKCFYDHSVAECNKTNPPSASELEAFAVKYSSPPYDYDTTCDMNLNQACVRVRVSDQFEMLCCMVSRWL